MAGYEPVSLSLDKQGVSSERDVVSSMQRQVYPVLGAVRALLNNFVLAPKAPNFTDATRPDPAALGAGAFIYNTDDGAPNWSNGTEWTDSQGVVT